MDADSQARQVLDRMALDFAQMVKRSDIDYYLKSSQTGTPDCTTCTAQTSSDPNRNDPTGNDQIAFFASTSGYYPTPGYQSPISLIAYRVNHDTTARNPAYLKTQRMGKGFIWNGIASAYKPILFLDNNTPPTNTISNQWPGAVSPITFDSDYEMIGSQVFRFEYYYLLKGQVVSGITYSPIFTDTPWDTRISGHTSVSSMRDVAAIIADIAVIDPKSKELFTDPNSQIAALAGQLGDYSSGMVPGQLLANWRSAIDMNTNGLPQPVLSGIRLYERYFYLNK
jgi:hypothetical protein